MGAAAAAAIGCPQRAIPQRASVRSCAAHYKFVCSTTPKSRIECCERRNTLALEHDLLLFPRQESGRPARLGGLLVTVGDGVHLGLGLGGGLGHGVRQWRWLRRGSQEAHAFQLSHCQSLSSR